MHQRHYKAVRFKSPAKQQFVCFFQLKQRPNIRTSLLFSKNHSFTSFCFGSLPCHKIYSQINTRDLWIHGSTVLFLLLHIVTGMTTKMSRHKMNLLENQVAILVSSIYLLQEPLWAAMSHTLAVHKQPSNHYSPSKLPQDMRPSTQTQDNFSSLSYQNELSLEPLPFPLGDSQQSTVEGRVWEQTRKI